METIQLIDDSTMAISQNKNGTWDIHWYKENSFEINIVGLTREGVDEYIETVSQEMESKYEL